MRDRTSRTAVLYFGRRVRERAMAEDLKDTIRDNASGPAKATGDLGSHEQHSLPDQIAADKHLGAASAVASRKTRGIRFNKLVPPGAV